MGFAINSCTVQPLLPVGDSGAGVFQACVFYPSLRPRELDSGQLPGVLANLTPVSFLGRGMARKAFRNGGNDDVPNAEEVA